MYNQLYAIRKNDHWGYINEEGSVVLDPSYKSVAGGGGGIYSFLDNKWKYGFCDLKGNVICEPRFDSVRVFSEGLCSVECGAKKGFIDTGFNFVYTYKYKKCFDYHEGIVVGNHENNYYVYLDRGGNVVLDRNYETTVSSEGLVVFRESLGNKCGYKSHNGEWVISPKYDLAREFSENMAAIGVRKGRDILTGFINNDGQVVILPKYYCLGYDGAGKFSEGMADISNAKGSGKKYGFININGELVIPCQYDMVHMFTSGLAAVAVNGKYGFIDVNGNIVIEPRFDSASSFSGSLAWVRLENKIGYINVNGDIIYLD